MHISQSSSILKLLWSSCDNPSSQVEICLSDADSSLTSEALVLSSDWNWHEWSASSHLIVLGLERARNKTKIKQQPLIDSSKFIASAAWTHLLRSSTRSTRPQLFLFCSSIAELQPLLPVTSNQPKCIFNKGCWNYAEALSNAFVSHHFLRRQSVNRQVMHSIVPRTLYSSLPWSIVRRGSSLSTMIADSFCERPKPSLSLSRHR